MIILDKKERCLKEVNLRNRQRIIDRKYEEEGLTDEVLALQVALNEERHRLDISDEDDRVFERFVQ